MPSDSELLRDYVKTASEPAFAEVVRRNVDFVYGVALRHARQPQRAEDATQAVFIDLARKAPSLAGRDDLMGWLYLSARYAALKIVRKEISQGAREASFEMQRHVLNEPTSKMDAERLQAVLDESLQELGGLDREAVLLRYFKDASFAQVGTALRVTEEAARKRVDRAVERLRGSLFRRGMASSSATLAAALAAQSASAAPAGLALRACQAAAAARSSGGLAAVLAKMSRLMSTSKALAGAALAAGLVAITGAFHEALATRRIAQMTVAAQESPYATEVSQARRSLEQAQKEQGDLEKQLRAIKEETGHPFDPAAADQSAGPRKVDDPQLSALAKTQARARNREFYGPFFVRMKWSRGQIEEFLNALTEHVSAEVYGSDTLDVTPAAHAWSNPARPGHSGIQVGADDWAGAAAAERALLGDEGLHQLQAYEREAPYQQINAALAGQLFASAPLTPQQADQLVRSWANAKLDFHGEPDDDWEGLLAHAQGILSGPQWEILRQLAISRSGLDLAAR